MGTQGAGRKRNPNKERMTAEEDALNLIAREAEARLAAKRAARAEAREIRMKELERQQKELSDDDERMSVGSRGSVRVEDRDYIEKGSRAASALTAATLTSLGGTSSRRGSGETAITVDIEAASIREIKDALVEIEEKYRKAMVSNAQLDNEKNNLMYQVDTLRDSLMELEELLSESRREYEDKAKDYEREKHAHSMLQFQFNEMKETLKQSEELLNKQGIVLGPDLNINGEVVETETEGSSSGDPASRLAQDSQTSPTEGNSMLGRARETQLRSSGEEELDPNQHQETLEAKESQLNSATPCSVANVSHLESSLEDQQTCFPTIRDTINESGLGKDSDNDIPMKYVKNEGGNVDIQWIETGPVKEDAGFEANGTGPKIEGGDLGETGGGSMGIKKVTTGESEIIVSNSSDDIRETSGNFLEEPVRVEACQLDTECTISSAQQSEVLENTAKISSPDDSNLVRITEPQHESDNADNTENEELEERSKKSQSHNDVTPGKKKRKKRKGKRKKRGTQEDENQRDDAKQQCLTEKEKGKTEEGLELVTRDNGPSVELEIDGGPIESPREFLMDPPQDDQEQHHTKETEEEQAVVSVGLNTESILSTTNPTDNSQITNCMDDNDAECTSIAGDFKDDTGVLNKNDVLQTELKIGSTKNETGSSTEGRLECPTNDPPNDNETTTSNANFEAESKDPISIDVASNKTDPANSLESNDNNVAPSKTAGHIECLEHSLGTEEPEIIATISSGKEDTEVTETIKDLEPDVEMEEKAFSCNVITADHDCDHSEPSQEELESRGLNEVAKESEHSLQPEANGVIECLEHSPGTEEPDQTTTINSYKEDTEVTESITDEQPDLEIEEKSFSYHVITADHDCALSELSLEEVENKELNEVVEESEEPLQPDYCSGSSPTDAENCGNIPSEKCCSGSVNEQNFSETPIQCERVMVISSCPVESQGLNTVEFVDQKDESNVEVSMEKDASNITEISLTERENEIGSFAEKDHSDGGQANFKDLDHQNSENVQELEKSPCPKESQENESDIIKPLDISSSKFIQHESDDDVEGQSFDFDDIDLEVDIKAHEEGVEKMSESVSAKVSNVNLGHYQIDVIKSNEDTEEQQQELPNESNDEKCTVDEVSEVDTRGQELDSVSEDHQSSMDNEEVAIKIREDESKEQQNAVEEISVAVEAKHILDENVGNPGETGFVEGNGDEKGMQALPIRIEEGDEVIKQELLGEQLGVQNKEGQVGGNTEPLPSKKDLKKNGKKGKGKGKEDCKMS